MIEIGTIEVNKLASSIREADLHAQEVKFYNAYTILRHAIIDMGLIATDMQIEDISVIANLKNM